MTFTVALLLVAVGAFIVLVLLGLTLAKAAGLADRQEEAEMVRRQETRDGR